MKNIFHKTISEMDVHEYYTKKYTCTLTPKQILELDTLVISAKIEAIKGGDKFGEDFFNNLSKTLRSFITEPIEHI